MRSSGFSAEDRLHNLFGGLAGDGLAAIGAVRRADGAVNHAQVIVDLGDRADRGARRTRGGFLLDGDGRRKALDGINIRALHLIEKLPRVGGKRFDVAALAFGVKRIESERGFTRTGKPCDHGERVAGYFQMNILQVVLPGAPDNDFFQAHVGMGCSLQDAASYTG